MKSDEKGFCLQKPPERNKIGSMIKSHSIFIISLDFELFWGEHDEKTIEGYKENILGARLVVPRLLKLFSAYNIHATWATVGLLFFEKRDDLIASLPAIMPKYKNSRR